MLPTNLITGTVAVAASAAFSAYAGLSYESQLFGRSLVAPPRVNQLALTFDDGPNPAATPRLLEILTKHQVTATFFFIGDFVLREPRLSREVHAAGHAIGNHTMHHLWLPRHSSATIRAELSDCNRVLEDTLGAPVTLFRPPHGARRPAVFRIAAELGLQPVQWNMMVGDWKDRSADDLFLRLARGIAKNRQQKRGTNVVLHDGSQHGLGADRSATVQAVAALLGSVPYGTEFVTPMQWSPRGTD
jgi:peptidoglycan/xylan/chitin deacetylase (PgdA/CDA1 family)